MRWEIRLSGTGGQGLVLAGIILATASSIEGKNVVQTQNYGPESRGGSSSSEVIIDQEEIYYPKVAIPNVLLCLSQEAVDTFSKYLEKDGIIIIDSTLKSPKIDGSQKLYKLPIIKTATDTIGKSIVTNMVALGAVVRATSIVSRESLSTAMKNQIPTGTEDINQRAIDAGMNLIEAEI